MLTIFTTMKPFRGHDKVIQTNALRSWVRLEPRPEVLLMGDGEGYAEVARELGLVHVPDVETNERGLPYLSDMFRIAQEKASNRLVCSLDGDVILLDDFAAAVRQAAAIRREFLMVGQTWGLSQREPLDTSRSGWQEEIRTRARTGGRTHGSWYGIDYFVFPRGAYPSFPRMVVARPGWDMYAVYDARRRGLMVIDATPVVDTIHQDHDYSHAGGADVVWKGQESKANTELMESEQLGFSVADATHLLTPRGLRLALRSPYLYRRLYAEPLVNPRLRFLKPIAEGARKATLPLRRRAGITVNSSKRS